jgi:hypothetical protein
MSNYPLSVLCDEARLPVAESSEGSLFGEVVLRVLRTLLFAFRLIIHVS